MDWYNELMRSIDPLHGAPANQREAFALWYRQARLPQVRYVTLLSAVLYVLFAILEQNVASNQPELRLTIHSLLALSLFTVVLLSHFAALYQPMLALLMLTPLIGVAANLYFNGQQEDFAYYAPELYLILVWTFVSGMSLRQAMLTAGLSVLMILPATLSDSLQPGMQHLHLLWLLAAFSFSLLSALLLEQTHKRMFLHQSELAINASTDSLTGLLNRASIDQLFTDELDRARRYGTPFSVILLDIDHFKQVNDNHGHAVGDSVLRQFAKLLRDNIRNLDRVGRMGGEEFMIVLPATDLQRAGSVALNLQQKINAFRFSFVEHKTASFGVTQYHEGDHPDGLLVRADRALYRAKASGRDRIELI